MKPADFLRLVSLAAIWGASFLFYRIAVPSLGALWTAELRVAIAAVAMLIYLVVTGARLDARLHWRAYLMMGVLNAALPWTLYAYAGLYLGAGTMAILNATTPLFAAVFAALWLGERFTLPKLAGLTLGVIGVSIVVGLGPVALSTQVLLGAAASIGATLCYAMSTTLLKRMGATASPIALSAATLIVGSFAIAPFLPPVPAAEAFSPLVIMAVLGVSLICSALAFVLFFRLVANVGATRTLTVAFLIPVFGVLWGWLFLGESVGAGMLVGGVTILIAMALVLRR